MSDPIVGYARSPMGPSGARIVVALLAALETYG
jgi:hypothetical protein